MTCCFMLNSFSRLTLFALLVAAFSFYLTPARADPDETVVYIVCFDADKEPVSSGSGVLISQEGRVLTLTSNVSAKAVTCAGSVGIADEHSLRRLNRMPPLPGVPKELTVFNFAKSETYTFAYFCRPGPDWVRKVVYGIGFATENVADSGITTSQQGILSTTQVNERGLINADLSPSEGMYGGPVYSENQAGILGLMYPNAEKPNGATSPIFELSWVADHLGLQKAPFPCIWPVVRVQSDWVATVETRIDALEAQVRQAAN